MCLQTFKTRPGRNTGYTPTIALVDYPLTPIHSDLPSNLSASPNPQESLLPHVTFDRQSVPTTGSGPHTQATTISFGTIIGATNRQIPGSSTPVRGSTTGSPSIPGSPSIRDESPAQDDPRVRSLLITGNPTMRPVSWYCHVCKHGPQSIANHANCIGILSTGVVCGHIKCDHCTIE